MSAGEFVKDAGPSLVALAGLGVAYANSRQPGREARHHARVETLYQDMLDTLQDRYNQAMERSGIGEIGSLPVRDPSTYQVTRARIRLYASGSVTEAWDRAHHQLLALELDHQEGRMKATMLQLGAVEAMIGDLAELMRRDLGVPDVPLRTRIWERVSYRLWLVTGGRRRQIKDLRSSANEDR